MLDLSPDCQRYLQGAAWEQDESMEYQSFLLSQAREDIKTARNKRAAADRGKKRVHKQMIKLNKFEPILSLMWLKKMTVKADKVDRIKEQLFWHKRIGGDINIPAGFHSLHKAKAWVVMVRAVQRHLHGVAHQKLKGTYQVYILSTTLNASHRTGGDQRRHRPIFWHRYHI